MRYDRIIKYVDVYENGEKMQNAGFIRLEVSEENVSMQMQISKLRVTDSYSCPIVLVAGEREAVSDEVALERGRGFWEKKQMQKDNLCDSIGYEDLQEIRVKLPGERVLRCIIREDNWGWKRASEQISPEAVSQPVPSQSIEDSHDAELLQESLSMDELEEQIEQEIFRRDVPAELPAQEPLKREVERVHKTPEFPPSADKWQQLLAIYPHIRPFEDMREYLLLKPQDLVVLPKKYFELSGNSFLLHGYYNYEHLILTKEKRRGEECFYIGVPGNFYYKEKQVAILFGFESFEGKTEPAGNGDFGYYMIPVEI